MDETGLHRFSGDLGMVDGLFVPSKYEVAGGRLEFVYSTVYQRGWILDAGRKRSRRHIINTIYYDTSSSYSLSSCWLEWFYLLQQKELRLDSIISSLYGIENKLNYYLDRECTSDWSELST